MGTNTFTIEVTSAQLFKIAQEEALEILKHDVANIRHLMDKKETYVGISNNNDKKYPFKVTFKTQSTADIASTKFKYIFEFEHTGTTILRKIVKNHLKQIKSKIEWRPDADIDNLWFALGNIRPRLNTKILSFKITIKTVS